MTGDWRWPATSLLGSISDASRGRLLDHCPPREYPADHQIITQGDHDTFVVVLLDGVVKVTGVSSAGREALLAVRVGGDLVGEFAAFDGLARSSSVTTCGPVAGCVLTQAMFLGVLSRDKLLADAVNRSVVAKVRAGNERRLEFTGFDANTRFARVVRELAVGHGERSDNRITISWPVTQSELASLAAVSEPTAQKALRRLRDAGVISTGYRTLVIEDFARLDSIAGSLQPAKTREARTLPAARPPVIHGAGPRAGPAARR